MFFSKCTGVMIVDQCSSLTNLQKKNVNLNCNTRFSDGPLTLKEPEMNMIAKLQTRH